MDAGWTVRAMRSVRRLSQREFAARAGVSPSTIDRIEAGRLDPRLRTFAAMIRAGGYYLVVADRFGRPLASRNEIDEMFDRAGRRFPAHLKSGPTPSYVSEGRQWWGWHHVAFPVVDDNVPANTYWRRKKRWPEMWDDAT